MAHLEVHPAHGSECATIRTMHLVDLHLKNPPEQVFVGSYPQEGLKHDDEVCQLRHHVGRKVLQLDSILMKESTKEVGRQNHEPMLVEVSERHCLPRLRTWHHLTDMGPHLVTSFSGRRPFAMRHCSFTSITDKCIHSPIS